MSGWSGTPRPPASFCPCTAGSSSRPVCGIRWLLEPALIEQATVAIRRLAPAAPVDQQELATRLLATIWAAGVVGGIGASDWARWAPELPAVCLRLARHTTGETL